MDLVVMDSWIIDSYKSKSLHWMRSKFIGFNWPCLKWEKAIFVILSRFLKYDPLQSYFELSEIFSFKKKEKKKPWLGSYPTLGANEKYFGDPDKINGSKKSLEQKSNVWERARRRKRHRLRVIQENFEEGYEKEKNGKEWECLSILRGAKEVSIEERQSKR